MQEKELDFLTEFIVQSDAIEGIVDNPTLVRKQLEGESAVGHVGALLALRDWSDERQVLTSSLVRRTQRLIVLEQPSKGEQQLAPRHIGQWRDCGVWVGGRAGMPAPQIRGAMADLIATVIHWQEERGRSDHPVAKAKFIAWFHWTYELIHPFVDGNGRSGRALVYHLYRFAGLEPFAFTAVDRFDTYYPCFSPVSEARMEQYFLNRTATS